MTKIIKILNHWVKTNEEMQKNSATIWKMARTDYKMNQSEFAELLGITNVWVSNIETKRRLPSIALQQKLLKLLTKKTD